MVMKMDHELTDAVVKGNNVETILEHCRKANHEAGCGGRSNRSGYLL